jgi:hypothetical protein
VNESPASTGYERSDADPRRLLLAGFVLALLLAASLAASAWLTQATEAELLGEERASPVRALRTPPSGPELLPSPARELEAVRAHEERLLSTTEWVDPVNGVVRIPIERAIELSLQEGFPVRAEAKK